MGCPRRSPGCLLPIAIHDAVASLRVDLIFDDQVQVLLHELIGDFHRPIAVELIVRDDQIDITGSCAARSSRAVRRRRTGVFVRLAKPIR